MEYIRATKNDSQDSFIEVSFRQVTDESNKQGQVYDDWKVSQTASVKPQV
jgi:hypothetical protein